VDEKQGSVVLIRDHHQHCVHGHNDPYGRSALLHVAAATATAVLRIEVGFRSWLMLRHTVTLVVAHVWWMKCE